MSFCSCMAKKVQFEEEALPKIYNAADFLQLGNLKVVIVESWTDQWELKDSSTMMEIAQSEEVAAPEIQLYHFLYTVWGSRKYKTYSNMFAMLPFLIVSCRQSRNIPSTIMANFGQHLVIVPLFVKVLM